MVKQHHALMCVRAPCHCCFTCRYSEEMRISYDLLILLKPLTIALCCQNSQITTGAASCSDDSLMRHIEEDQRIAISVMCTNLHIAADDLLTEDVITHKKVLAVVAVSVNKYFELSMHWKCHQSFVKKKSSISIKHSDVKKAIDSLKTELIKLAGLRVVTTNLALQLLSIQAKLSAGCRKCRYIFTSEADKEHHM